MRRSPLVFRAPSRNQVVLIEEIWLKAQKICHMWLICKFVFMSVFKKHGKLVTFLRSFMKSRPPPQKLRQRGILRERVFGCDLGEHLHNCEHEGKIFNGKTLFFVFVAYFVLLTVDPFESTRRENSGKMCAGFAKSLLSLNWRMKPVNRTENCPSWCIHIFWSYIIWLFCFYIIWSFIFAWT